MTCCQNDRTEKRFSRMRGDSLYFPVFYKQVIHTCFKMDFPSTLQNGVPHVFYNLRQFIRTNMRVRIRQNGGAGSVLAKYIQYLLHIAPFFAAGIELSIGIGSCASFSETIIRFGVYLMFPGNKGDILFTVPYILSTLHYNRLHAQLYKS